MRVLIVQPGEVRPKIAEMTKEEIRGAIIGYPTALDTHHFGHDIMVITGTDAKAVGSSPNRIVDGRLLFGTMIVCRRGMTDLPILVARDLQTSTVWQMAQYAAHDKPA